MERHARRSDGRRRARGRPGRRAGMDARPAGRAGCGGCWHDAGGHQRGRSDAARAQAHAARIEARRRRLRRAPGPDRARGHLLRPVEHAHRPDSRPTTASSATAGTSATSARSSSGASTTSSCRARRSGRPRAARSPASARRTCAGGTRWARPPTSPSRRGRSTTPTAASRRIATRSRPQLHDNLTGPLGDFPLFQYWGPTASIKSTKWIADAAKIVLDNESLDLLLVYLPHLDYDHQRFGPEGPEAEKAAQELDEVAGDLIDHARGRGDQVVVLSEYGITPAQRPGRDQPRPAPRRAAERLHAGRDGVPGPVDLTRVRGLRPPDRARVRREPGGPAGRARGDRFARRRGGGARRRVAGRGRAGARALRRTGRPGRARRLVHVPLLARQRARPGLRPPGGDPPQAGLRPGGAADGPGRREGREAPRAASRSRAR